MMGLIPARTGHSIQGVEDLLILRGHDLLPDTVNNLLDRIRVHTSTVRNASPPDDAFRSSEIVGPYVPNP